MEFLNIVSADWYKTKRTGNLLISLLLPIAVTLFAVVVVCSDGVRLEGKEDGSNAWLPYSQIILTLYTMLLPFFVALVTFSMSNIEHKNHGLKQIFTLPVSKFKLYFSKVVVLLIWVTVVIVMAYGTLLLGGNLLGGLLPDVGFVGNGLDLPLGSFFLRTFFSLFAIMAIHFLLSIYWNNFIISIGFACFMMVFGMISFSWEWSFLIPYCSFFAGVEDYFNNVSTIFTREIIVNLIYGVAFLAIGYLMMLKKSIK